jgi:AcrR family transcriptional regulator
MTGPLAHPFPADYQLFATGPGFRSCQEHALSCSAPTIRTWTARLQRPACCRYTRADRLLIPRNRTWLPIYVCRGSGLRGQSAARLATLGHDGGMDSPRTGPRVTRARMTGPQRREQLVAVGRAVFAEKGYDATSVEEVAARAKVSKPVVYEHFGGKEGLYAVIVDREIRQLLAEISQALSAGGGSRLLVERAALALLGYIETSTDGFRILVRDSPVTQSSGTFSSLINDVASQVEHLLAAEFKRRNLDSSNAPMYAQMLVGMVALTGQWWLDTRVPDRRTVAEHLVNLAWNGLSGLEAQPRLRTAEQEPPATALL